MILLKKTNVSGNWTVGEFNTIGNTKYLQLNTDSDLITSSTIWNNTSPTSTVVSIGTSSGVNSINSTYTAYCFKSVEGFSKIGSYEGNNSSSDNAFVFTGFLPSFLLIKNIDADEDWTIRDIEHSGYYTDRANPIPIGVQPSTSTNATGGSAFSIDLLSNGFKVRGNNADVGASNTYVYLAFASNPFKFNNAR